MVLGAEGNFVSGENEEEAEYHRHPGDLHQERSQGDEDAPENECSDDAIKEDPVAVLLRDGEKVKNNQKDKEVVDREALLNEITGKKIETALVSKRHRVKSSESRVEWKMPAAVEIKSGTEQECQSDPRDHR